MKEHLIIKISKELEYWEPGSPKDSLDQSDFHLPFKVECFSKVPKLSSFSCHFITFSSFSFPNFSLHVLWNMTEWLNKDVPKASPPLNSLTSIGTWRIFSDSNFSMPSPSSSYPLTGSVDQASKELYSFSV